jgi:hypothetical protein
MWKLLIVLVLIVAGAVVVRQLLAQDGDAGDGYIGMPEPSETEI